MMKGPTEEPGWPTCGYRERKEGRMEMPFIPSASARRRLPTLPLTVSPPPPLSFNDPPGGRKTLVWGRKGRGGRREEGKCYSWRRGKKWRPRICRCAVVGWFGRGVAAGQKKKTVICLPPLTFLGASKEKRKEGLT